MTHKWIAVVISITMIAFCWHYRGFSEEQQGKATKKIMEEKLKNAQKLLEGIALADFNKITGNTEALLQLSKTEEWMVHKTPKFEMHNNEFQRAAENVIAKAKLKNIDGVTLAYFELTMSCVRCHAYVRQIRALLQGGPQADQVGSP